MNRAPLIIAIVLLLLPVLYVGSYLALVTPSGTITGFRQATAQEHFDAGLRTSSTLILPVEYSYRYGGNWSERIFWPLQQIDRRVRPRTWETAEYAPERWERLKERLRIEGRNFAP
jgi:hypothetical protein